MADADSRQLDLMSASEAAGKCCAFCGKFNVMLRREINPPDASTQMFKFFCDTPCEANWGTGQMRRA